ncbi:MAG: phosphoribosylamine--glycine ligase [Gemmatimonadota bacterium]|uniref:phosphoribosylamine--glycine ligase n=1 Tax=Candidatus Palauibacter scopulicola TaxID=3056741 RepID=UPI002386E215|nr:phosphoribosylamine--glycine ligase [Candidatus Palauibacter scopulicola]MDE2663505.1 phosphoribosylamine--glycine ligase [Candidatus Palauibacter scopulicola]
MNLLIVGSGGREHAFADCVRRDAPDATIYAAPGNPGMLGTAELVNIGAADIGGLLDFAAARRIDLTVVGPEAPLAAGVADRFAEAGLPVFGPDRAGARLEASKAFAKRLMRDCGVPTADHETFDDAAAALDYVAGHEEPLVVKASGLAAGKGAIVCETRGEARRAIEEMMVDRKFGDAGGQVVIEEFMRGVELSVFFLADGERAVPLLTSRDYKRVGEGDRGLNTGGMGAYSPAAPADPDFIDEVRREIAQPVLDAMAESGAPYRGFLYAGLMLTAAGPRVVEFNCRMGDPETQVVLPLTSSNLLEPMLRVAHRESLAGWHPEAAPGHALVTVMASAGYPESSDAGRPIEIPDFDPAEVRVFHAGTAMKEGRLVTAGGRVLGITGFGGTLEEAARRSREAAARVRFDGAHSRSDIGWHELNPDRLGPDESARIHPSGKTSDG